VMSRERAPEVVLAERAEHMAYLATELIYERQPELWEMGENGRARTHEDFGHHFRALARGVDAFRAHVDYCYDLFTGRGFPHRWLDDAWAIMEEICRETLSASTADVALETLSVTGER
jgi:hypothetical protein